MISEIKNPRLAKYGFAIEMSENILSEGSALAIIHEILKDVPESEDSDGAWFHRFGNNMGNWVLRIYINDKKLYDAINLVMGSRK